MVKECEYGHHWYSGSTCPLCQFLGEDNLREVYDESSRI